MGSTGRYGVAIPMLEPVSNYQMPYVAPGNGRNGNAAHEVEIPAHPDLSGHRIMFLGNDDWYFCSHRMSLAIALANCGADVVVMANDSGFAQSIRNAGLKFHNWKVLGGSRKPAMELIAFQQALSAVSRL